MGITRKGSARRLSVAQSQGTGRSQTFHNKRRSSDDSGTVIIETVFFISIVIPLVGGMVLFGRVFHERALLSQALRMSARPASFSRSVELNPSEPLNLAKFKSAKYITRIQDQVCELAAISLTNSKLHPDDYDIKLDAIVLKAQNGRSDTFLAVEAKRNNFLQVPFVGSVTGATARTVYPLQVARLGEILPGLTDEESNGLAPLVTYNCPPQP